MGCFFYHKRATKIKFASKYQTFLYCFLRFVFIFKLVKTYILPKSGKTWENLESFWKCLKKFWFWKKIMITKLNLGFGSRYQNLVSVANYFNPSSKLTDSIKKVKEPLVFALWLLQDTFCCMLDFLAFDASRGVPMYFDLLGNVFWVVEFLPHMDFKRDLNSFKRELVLNTFGKFT